jgi:hypothetical protein
MSASTTGSAERIPQVGDIVHWYEFVVHEKRLVARAAIVTDVHEPENAKTSVSLTVFLSGKTDAGTFQRVSYSDKPTDGCWGWRPDQPC